MDLNQVQIKALPLVDKQKLVVELSQVPIGDRGYANARAVIELIKADRKYVEPKKVTVKVLEDVPMDGQELKKDTVIEVLPWQASALARFFEVVTKAAALIALLCCLVLPASAQNYKLTSLLASPWSTNLVAGGATSNYWQTYSNSTVLTNMSVIISNGTPVFTTNYVTNITVSIPGVIGLTKSCQTAVTLGFTDPLPSMVSNTLTATFYWSLDGTTNTWYPAFVLANAVTTPGVSNTIYSVGTNLWPVPAGYLILSSIVNAGTNSSLPIITVAQKPWQ
jgi:hypothetical protein